MKYAASFSNQKCTELGFLTTGRIFFESATAVKDERAQTVPAGQAMNQDAPRAGQYSRCSTKADRSDTMTPPHCVIPTGGAHNFIGTVVGEEPTKPCTQRANRRGGGHLPFPEVRACASAPTQCGSCGGCPPHLRPRSSPRLRNAKPSEGDRETPLSFRSQRLEHRPRFGSHVSPRKIFLFYRIVHWLCCTTNLWQTQL